MRIVCRAVRDKHEALLMACRSSAIRCHSKAALLFKCQIQSSENGEKTQAEISTCFSCHPAHNDPHKNTSLPLKSKQNKKEKKWFIHHQILFLRATASLLSKDSYTAVTGGTNKCLLLFGWWSDINQSVVNLGGGQQEHHWPAHWESFKSSKCASPLRLQPSRKTTKKMLLPVKSKTNWKGFL